MREALSEIIFGLKETFCIRSKSDLLIQLMAGVATAVIILTVVAVNW